MKQKTKWRQINDTTGCFFEKINNIGKPTATLTRGKKGRLKLPVVGIGEVIALQSIYILNFTT